jgi:hypothetical protein
MQRFNLQVHRLRFYTKIKDTKEIDLADLWTLFKPNHCFLRIRVEFQEDSIE